jgi:hypothetical protein
VILTPLQNAVQLMEERVKAVRDAVKSNNATVISGLLYGNLMTTISEGIHFLVFHCTFYFVNCCFA